MMDVVGSERVTVCLCGDVMTGRGVDQALAHPGDPELREPQVSDARSYLRLAERVNGPIPRPVDGTWLWGDALEAMAAAGARVINLETSVTAGGEFAPGKAIHYRMNPANIGCLTVARPDVCVLANNHVLDFGQRGLASTLGTLTGAGLAVAGAGRSEEEAQRPALVDLPGGGRLAVLAAGAASSGVDPAWAAGPAEPGVSALPGLAGPAADAQVARVAAVSEASDIVIVSLHWGPNWGYEPGEEEVRFAHRLIDAGADLVHGHSSHHPRPVEVYRGRLILYGCGDFIDDYEGIGGYEEYRDDLRLVYLATLAAGDGAGPALRMLPFQARRLRLWHASDADTRWLAGLLTRISRRFGTTVDLTAGGTLALRTPSQAG